MKAIKLILTCPSCGNSTWVRRDNSFECLSCEDVYDPEEMACNEEEK